MRASGRWFVTAFVGVLSCVVPTLAGAPSATGANWSAPEGFPPCEICFTDVDGNPFCGQDLFCDETVTCGSDADCPEGSRCARDTCCGSEAICIVSEECTGCINPGVCFYYEECIPPVPCATLEFPVCGGGECPEGQTCVADSAGEGRCACDFEMVVVLEYFRAEVTRHGVRLRWKTAVEIDTVGFRVLRETERDGEKRLEPVGSSPIPARGFELAGAQYELIDAMKRPASGTRYYLEDIDLWGRVTRHGPVTIEVRQRGHESPGH